MMRKSILCIGVIGFCASCVSDDDVITQLGFVEYEPQGLKVEMPDQVLSGEPFELTVATYGNSCISLHSTDIEYAAEAVLVTPYDEQHGTSCNLILLQLQHRVELLFDAPGQKRITIRGRKSEQVGTREEISEVSHNMDVLVE